MDKKTLSRLLPVIFLGLIVWIIPTPQGLIDITLSSKLAKNPAGAAKFAANTWHMFGIYAAILCGLILKPFAEPIIVMIILAVASLFMDPTKVYAGYGSPSVVFLLSVVLACGAFTKTGLGKRIAFVLLEKLGKTKFGGTSIGLAYILLMCDLILSPATGSNTSRSAIVFPIFKGVCESLGSTPTENPKKLGAYLELTYHMISMGTAVLFLTGMASNAVIASTIQSSGGAVLSWMFWFKAAIVPGLVVLFIIPLVMYKLYRPEMKELGDIDHLIVKAKAEMGPMKSKEKILLGIFIFAILGWMFGPQIVIGPIKGVDMQVVAFLFIGLELLFGIMNWDDLLKEKMAWSMYMWYGGFFGSAAILANGKFYPFLASLLKEYLNLAHVNGWIVILILLIMAFAVKYFFVSNSAYIGAIYPIILTLALTTQANITVLSLLLAFFGGYSCWLTNYGNGASIYIYSQGYVDQKDWYRVGTIMVGIVMLIYVVVALPYWKILGIY